MSWPSGPGQTAAAGRGDPQPGRAELWWACLPQTQSHVSALTQVVMGWGRSVDSRAGGEAQQGASLGVVILVPGPSLCRVSDLSGVQGSSLLLPAVERTPSRGRRVSGTGNGWVSGLACLILPAASSHEPSASSQHVGTE